MVLVWLTACGWFSSGESELPTPAVTGSLTGRPKAGARAEPAPLTDEQVAMLDDLFARSTELVRAGEPGGFRSATITFVQTDLEEFRPDRGEDVTVVPAAEGLGPHTLRVAEVTEAELFVQLTTTSTSDPAWLAAPAPAGERPEMLGRATLLYPVVAGARRGDVPSDLPEGITGASLVGVVDVTGDDVGDVLTSEHCCEDTMLPAGDACDGGACLVTWVRTAEGWRVAEES